MFAEPQSITVNGVAASLPRTEFGNRSGVFESLAAGLRLRVSQVMGRRNRRTVRVDISKTAADPLLDGVSRKYSMSAYLVIDDPELGFTPKEIEDNVKSLTTWLTVPGNLTKVVAGES